MISAAVAHPTETIKCKLQLQMVQPNHVPKQFAGPIDVVRQTVQGQGITGMWKGVGASFIYRSCFAAMFGGELFPSAGPPEFSKPDNQDLSFSIECLSVGKEPDGRCPRACRTLWLED